MPLQTDSLPSFINEAAVIPKYPVQQYNRENNFDEITLDVNYKQGRFSLPSFKITGKKNQSILQQSKRGEYDDGSSNFNIVLNDVPFTITSNQLDNLEISLSLY